MKIKFLFLASLLVGMISAPLARDTKAQFPTDCPNKKPTTTPSQNTHIYQNNRLGLSFEFPANYQGVQPHDRPESFILTIVDPVNYQHHLCVNRESGGHAVFPEVSLEVIPVNSPIAILIEL